jgi:hypothetical protein
MPIVGPTTDHDEIKHWAEKHRAVPAEILPPHLNHEPAVLRMMLPQIAADHKDIRVLAWDEFFAKFDLLGLSFVYANDHSGYNEILQIDGRNPYRNSRNQPIDPHNEYFDLMISYSHARDLGAQVSLLRPGRPRIYPVVVRGSRE